jgi:hypothetical protein
VQVWKNGSAFENGLSNLRKSMLLLGGTPAHDIDQPPKSPGQLIHEPKINSIDFKP